MLARSHSPMLGAVGYAMTFIGGILTDLISYASVYCLGFVLIVGFDKMGNVSTVAPQRNIASSRIC